MKKTDHVKITLRVDAKLYEKVVKLAKVGHRSVTAQINYLIEQAIAKGAA